MDDVNAEMYAKELVTAWLQNNKADVKQGGSEELGRSVRQFYNSLVTTILSRSGQTREGRGGHLSYGGVVKDNPTPRF